MRTLSDSREIIGTADNQVALTSAWRSLTSKLAERASEAELKQQGCIPVVSYNNLLSGDERLISRIKECGTAVVTNVIPEEEAQRWLREIEAYVAANPQVKGFPEDDKQVFEVYWSKPQLEARAHPRSTAVQSKLLGLFGASLTDSPDAKVSLTQPLMYADRLRVRHPGDSRFALGPHMDGGSIERWEDPTYRQVYAKILQGKWEEYNAFEIEHRVRANQNLYDGPGACGVFRAFQGWTSLSDTGPGEGTLRVYPFLNEMTAYTLMRPLFKEKAPRAALTREQYLAPENWELDTTTTAFPGAPPARAQEFSDATHPHLQLDRSVVSIPHVRPGDQAWWHADVIHAVEPQHRGTGPSAVMYIPTVPLTELNANYVRDQRESFIKRVPPPDFPGGEGESTFKGTGTPDDIVGEGPRRAMGLERIPTSTDLLPGDRAVREAANKIFGF